MRERERDFVRHTVQQKITLDVLMTNTNLLLQEAQNNQTQNTMTEHDDPDIDPNDMA